MCVGFIVAGEDPDGFSHKILRVALLVPALYLKIITIYGTLRRNSENTFLLAGRASNYWAFNDVLPPVCQLKFMV